MARGTCGNCGKPGYSIGRGFICPACAGQARMVGNNERPMGMYIAVGKRSPAISLGVYIGDAGFANSVEENQDALAEKQGLLASIAKRS